MKKIVYDDSKVGTLIAAWPSKHNFEVIMEPRSDRVLKVIEVHVPDLVLLDILLPRRRSSLAAASTVSVLHFFQLTPAIVR